MDNWNHAYYSQDGDDIVCSNCGYIIGFDEDLEICPNCNAEFVRFDNDNNVKVNYD